MCSHCLGLSSAAKNAIRSRAVRRVCLLDDTNTSTGFSGEWVFMAATKKKVLIKSMHYKIEKCSKKINTKIIQTYRIKELIHTVYGCSMYLYKARTHVSEEKNTIPIFNAISPNKIYVLQLSWLMKMIEFHWTKGQTQFSLLVQFLHCCCLLNLASSNQFHSSKITVVC